MRIAYVQFEPRLGESDYNRSKAAEMLARAAEADLVVLPELANSGYSFTSPGQARATAESAESGPFVTMLIEQCRRHAFHIVAGLNELESDLLHNTAVLVGPDGVVGKYRKIHRFVDEKDIFQPGNLGLPVFDIGEAKIGLLICFDWMFPEIWRILALKGADIICHPSNLVIPGLCQKAVPIHALINGVYTITANRLGTEGDLSFTGLSIMCGPRGEVLAQAPADSEEVRSVEIDIARARDKAITRRNDRFADRRTDQYREILD